MRGFSGAVLGALAIGGVVSLAGLGATLAQPAPAGPPGSSAGPAGFTENGLMQFQARCLGCHGNPKVERAPSPQVLRAMPPERIYAALTTGVMKTIGDTLTDVQKRQIAESTAGRLMGAEAAGRP